MSLGNPNHAGANQGMAIGATKCEQYIQDAVAFVQLKYKSNDRVAWDEMRHEIWSRLGDIPSPNCWGNISMALIRQGVMLDTGRMVHSRFKACHARKVPEYVFL